MKYQIRKSCFETNSSSMHSLIITKENENIRMTQEEIRDEFYLNEEWYKERHKNDEKEIVNINPWENEFGRSPFSVLSSFRDKLAYAIAEYCGDNYRMESYVKAEETFDEVFRPLLIRLIGCNEIEWDKWDNRHFVVYSDKTAEQFNEFKEVPYEKLIYIDKSVKDKYSDDEMIYGGYRNIDKDGKPIEDAWFDVPDFGGIDHQSSGLLMGFLEDNNLTLEDYLVRKDVVVIIDGDEYCELNHLINCGLIKKDSIVLRFPNRGSFDDFCFKEKNENEKMG